MIMVQYAGHKIKDEGVKGGGQFSKIGQEEWGQFSTIKY
jgi:hypothetical protein